MCNTEMIEDIQSYKKEEAVHQSLHADIFRSLLNPFTCHLPACFFFVFGLFLAAAACSLSCCELIKFPVVLLVLLSVPTVDGIDGS